MGLALTAEYGRYPGMYADVGRVAPVPGRDSLLALTAASMPASYCEAKDYVKN